MAGLRPSAPVPRSAGGQVAQSRASRTIDPWDVALASSAGESRACSWPLVPSLWQQAPSGLRRARPPTSPGSRSWSGLFLSSRRHVSSPMASSRGEFGRFSAAESIHSPPGSLACRSHRARRVVFPRPGNRSSGRGCSQPRSVVSSEGRATGKVDAVPDPAAASLDEHGSDAAGDVEQ